MGYIYGYLKVGNSRKFLWVQKLLTNRYQPTDIHDKSMNYFFYCYRYYYYNYYLLYFLICLRIALNISKYIKSSKWCKFLLHEFVSSFQEFLNFISFDIVVFICMVGFLFSLKYIFQAPVNSKHCFLLKLQEEVFLGSYIFFKQYLSHKNDFK